LRKLPNLFHHHLIRISNPLNLMGLRTLHLRPKDLSNNELIRRLPPQLRLAAIRDLLEVADHNELEPCILELIALATPPGLSTKTHQFVRILVDFITASPPAHALPPKARALLVRDWHRLSPPARRLARSIEGADWSAAIHEQHRLAGSDPNQPGLAAYLDESDDSAHLPIAVDLLRAEDRGVSEAGERVLLRAAAGLIRTPGPERPERLRLDPTGNPPVLSAVVDAMRQALDRYDAHERSSIPLAALLLLDRAAADPALAQLDPILRILSDAHHPAFASFRRAIRRDESPAIRRLAWRLLPVGPLEMACLERLAIARTDLDHAALLNTAHLALRPRRASRAALLATAGPPVAGKSPPSALPLSTRGLSPRARRALPRLLACIPASDELRERLHLDALTDPDPLIRLVHARSARASELADFCLDPAPEVATLATLRWSLVGIATPSTQAGTRHARLARALARSPHDAVRRIARDEPHAFSADDADPLARARMLAVRPADRAALARAWLASAREGSPETRIAAIRAARRCALLAGWSGPLRELIEDPAVSPRVAATAAAALGDVPDRSAPEALEPAFGHADARVRANAIESLERAARRGDSPGRIVERVLEFKSSHEHRTRANALRALARRGEPRTTGLDAVGADLERMLSDERAAHRLAGVWLAERLLCPAGPLRKDAPWQGLARLVADLARNDHDGHIRARARRCSGRLLAEIARTTRTDARPNPGVTRTRERIARLTETEKAR
jgi:hypothetical protein